MAFNTWDYIRQFRETEIRRADLLSEKAFHVFFIRSRTGTEYKRFLHSYHKIFERLGAGIIGPSFIYQNNLFIHFEPGIAGNSDQDRTEAGSIVPLYRLFGVENAVNEYLQVDPADDFRLTVNNIVINHNGSGLPQDLARSRVYDLKRDLEDASDLIRGNKSGGRLVVFNELTRRIRESATIVAQDPGSGVNPYVSRVALIVPMNLLHLISNLANDTTTDIVDFAESVVQVKGPVLKVEKRYLKSPDIEPNNVMYSEVDLYPRYLAIHMPDLFSSRWHGLLYKRLEINNGFMDLVEKLHLKGHYLFSYEKSQIIRDRVRKINIDIRANHLQFYLTDLSMGIAIPFMISLFAFVHLKSEFAFLLMFKNRIRELLTIFWLMPLIMVMAIKVCLTAAYLVYPATDAALAHADAWPMVLPMAFSFLAVSIFFYPINRWCFSPFTGNRLSLALLHKGK